MTNKDLEVIGFEYIPHLTIGNSMTYQLGRNRFLSAGAIGTPNEMLFICELARYEKNKISDLICLHNYDYDGPLTESKLKSLIDLLYYKDKVIENIEDESTDSKITSISTGT